MKKIFTYLVMFSCFTTLAQSVPLENRADFTVKTAKNQYFEDSNGVLNKFLGKWRYQNSPTNPTKIFEITFSKEVMVDVGGIYSTDQLVSKFKYIENGVTIMDTYASVENDYISGSAIYLNSLSEIELSYNEPNIGNLPENKIPHGTLKVQFVNNTNPKTLRWSVSYYKTSPDSTFKLPLGMILKKIN